MTRITAIIPVKNGAAYLGAAIESVLAEPVDELIVVDGHSTDGSLEIARGYAKDRRVAAVLQQAGGVSNGRNFGLKMATGDLIAFLDADDTWVKGKTERQVRALQVKNAELALASCGVDQFLEPGTALPATLRADRIGESSLLVPSTLVCHRKVFGVVGGFEPGRGYAEDVDWYNRAFRLGVERVHVPDVLVRKRVHGTSASQRNVSTEADIGRMQAEIGLVLSREVTARMYPVF